MEDITTLPIYSSEGKVVDKLSLDPKVFDGTVNTAAMHQVVCAFRAGQRKGLASTKTRGEVSGGGKKPWKQKGTGRARVGSIRSPLWKHGGVVFGPHPRDFSYDLPKKIKTLALKSSLNVKLGANSIVVLDSFNPDTAKTKDALRVFLNLKLLNKNKPVSGKTLLLLNKPGVNLKLALRNLDFLNVNRAEDTHTYEVLSARKLVITKDAFISLVKRLK